MLIIDASAALYLLASENGIGPFADLGLAAPALLWSELTSVLSEMRWRGELSVPLADAVFDRLLSSPSLGGSTFSSCRATSACAEEPAA